MKTKEANMTLEVIKDDLIDFIDNEPMDMLDEFTSEEIADCVISVAKKLEIGNTVVDKKLISYSDRGNKDYMIRVNNSNGGFVSVSDNCGTGVSNTRFFPYYSDGNPEERFEGLCNLASMINEAWYTLKY